MKKILLTLSLFVGLLFSPLVVQAQSVDLKGVQGPHFKAGESFAF